jgi:hypothetical protein
MDHDSNSSGHTKGKDPTPNLDPESRRPRISTGPDPGSGPIPDFDPAPSQKLSIVWSAPGHCFRRERDIDVKTSVELGL